MGSARIREAVAGDVDAVAALIGDMLHEMERYGGQATAASAERAAFFADEMRQRLADPVHRYAIAVDEPEGTLGVASARIVTLPSAFRPRRELHISTVYVVPPRRGAGIGRMLLEDLLAWGRSEGCATADLNVLDGNPARRLYERLGFRDVQRKMVREL
jgi:GNAT superfamily N-acetyltransferase